MRSLTVCVRFCIVLLSVYWIDTTEAAIPTKNMWNTTHVDQLKHDLLYKYDKFARPAQHFNTTTVNMELTITHVEIDEAKSMMIVNALDRLEWIDEKLKWNASDYGGLKNLHIADHEIWQPDIVLYNSAQANNIDHYGNTHCIVKFDGTVLWVPPTQLPIFCQLDMTWWPYDSQTCELYFGSWTYSGEQINFTTKEGLKSIQIEDGAGEWEVTTVIAKRHEIIYSCCPEPYHRIDYVITVKRRSPVFHTLLITPAAMSVVLTLAVFWMTPSASEKFLLSGVTIIMISMYLIYFAQRLTMASSNTPVIVQFYSVNLCLVCLSMVVSVLTYNLSKKVDGRPVPWIIIKPLTGRLGSLLALPTAKNSVFHQNFIDKGGEELQECNLVKEECSKNIPNHNNTDWFLVATAVDRIMFLVYVFIFIILILFCLI